jgi:hypothetical protein
MPNKKIAVLIDSENTPSSKLPLILDELSGFGQIIVKRAYGDFSLNQLKNWKQPLNEVGKYLKRLKPDFDPRSYELKKLSDFFKRVEGRYQTRKVKGSGMEFKLITKSESK